MTSKRIKVSILAAGAIALVGVAAPASAHHSHAMFDPSKKMTLVGTVKEFQWTNPHIWLQLMVPNEKGEMVEWSLEGATPVQLQRRGWRRTSLVPGEKVTVVTNPLRSGQPGGTLGVVTKADGSVVGSRDGGA
jgi:hypothetical protein